MDPRSEVLLRQPELFQGKILLAGLPADELLTALPRACGWSWHVLEHTVLAARYSGRLQLGTAPPAEEFESAVLFLPKSRELTDYLLQALAAGITDRGRLFLIGEKRQGVERAARQLAYFGTPIKLDSARHCQLWQVEVTQPCEYPSLGALATTYALSLGRETLQVVSLPGVFSHGRLDKGTALLLENLEHLPEGDMLDYGCGSGIVGAAMKALYPHNRVFLLDVDAFALESSRRTLQANALEALVVAGGSLNDAPGPFAAIVSNPPFHQGVQTDYHATETLLSEAFKHLHSHGELRLVANSFLKYPALMEKSLAGCQTLAERDGFRVYRAATR